MADEADDDAAQLAEALSLYLPTHLNTARVLFPPRCPECCGSGKRYSRSCPRCQGSGTQDNDQFLVDNRELKSPAQGLGYRSAPELGSKDPNGLLVGWGGTVTGVEVKSGWIRVDSFRVADALPLLDEAKAAKEVANALVKEKRYTEANKRYEAALEILDRCRGETITSKEARQLGQLRSVIHSNVAQCFLNLKLYRRAVDSASSALDNDPNNAKALYRRSSASEILRDWDAALRDLAKLRRLGGEGISEELERRFDSLFERNLSVNRCAEEVSQEKETMDRMKVRFDDVMKKYGLEGSEAANQTVQWLCTDKSWDGDQRVVSDAVVQRMVSAWQMESKDARDMANWIQKGINLGIIPVNSAKAPS